MAPNVAIRGISRRGFRIRNSSGDWVTVKEGVAATVDLAHKGTRAILSREKDNFVRVTNTGTTTAFIKGLSRSGFRMLNNAGTAQVKVAQNTAPVQANLNSGPVKRTLRRQKRDFIRVTGATSDKVNIFGLTDGLSFRSEDSELTMVFPGSNNDLTFVLKDDGVPSATTVQLEAVRNTSLITVSVTGDNIKVALATDNGTQATAVVNPTGSNNGITYTMKTTGAGDGTAGNAYTITYVVPSGNNQPLTASVSGTVITISLATDGGGAVSTTANALVSAVNAGSGSFAPVNALVTAASTEGDGSGLLTAMSPVAFTGGVNWAVTSTAANVKTAIEAHSGSGMGFANNRVTVTYEGTGAGLVGAFASTKVAGGPLTISAGSTTYVNLADPFNVAQLRRHYRSWIEA